MDGHSPLRMKLLIVFLLVSTNIVCLHGHNTTGAVAVPHCVTDYLYTITCSLSMAPSDSNFSYWLTFQKRKKRLLKMDYLNCDDDIVFPHSFVQEGIVKPNAPCCLTVWHNASQHHFTWNSTYEFAPFTNLVDSLKFQLQFYRKGDAQNVRFKDEEITLLVVSTLPVTNLDCSVDDQHFDPDTEYAARVRTSPDQQHYKGEWSDWSPEVYWKTEAAVNDPPPYIFLLGLGKVLIPLFVLVPFTLIFVWAPVKK
ncbi:hypothetical protein F7725_025573 [Dissostichus mawsoni]|uniref:Uncharacterized protein n=1 Tax=Dissostichus mawsoni TaxID=36200 RepID=A0A7J5XCH1_DISMA|nr:hypothetical protein F7725_025573 [Dissostichus mawsoni]